jgi:hypothetical protein
VAPRLGAFPKRNLQQPPSSHPFGGGPLHVCHWKLAALRPNPARHALLLSYRRQIRSLSRRNRTRARRSGRGHFARQAHCGRAGAGQRILSFQRRVCSSDCCSRTIIQSRSKRGGPRRDDLNAAPRDAGQPISCPCSLQRIPDVRTGKLPLRSLPRVGRHPAIQAACRARLISDWKAIFCHGSFVKRGRSETLPHRVHRARDCVDDRLR